MADCPATLLQQSQMAAATNAALAAMPQAPNYYASVGGDLASQQAYLMQQFGWAKPAPHTLYPYKPSDGQQFWVKETDGTWTLRSHTDIINGEVSPGQWQRHPTSGYFYFVRTG